MNTSLLLITMAIIAAMGYALGRSRSLALASNIGGIRFLNSLPFYYGMLVALWCSVPSLILLGLWTIFDGHVVQHIVTQELPHALHSKPEAELGLILNQVQNIAKNPSMAQNAPDYMLRAAERINEMEQLNQWLMTLLVMLTAIVAGIIVWLKIHPQLKARIHVEKAFRTTLFLCSGIAVLTTVGIVMSMLFESLRFFSQVSIIDFLFGLKWSPQTAIRADQMGSSSSFGAIPLFSGTLVIALIAMIVAVPTGLMAAIYLSEYASKRVRSIAKPALEILAGIPTVVYGFFAALTVAPFIRELSESLGMNASSESALAAGLVMGIMIIPFVSSLSDDVINAVPQSLRDGALGLGATQSEVVKQIVIPAALPGIFGGVLLAVSRAIGETMIVVMAAGLAANLTFNPLDTVTTVTVQIVMLLVGDQEFDSAKTLAAFALGLTLFIVTLALNFIAFHVVRKYREQYD